ncbi:hypothetical protein M3Y99_01700500 [Aphelenchoides fujianensis]|nr:hypothetical protein M3Y99_01700500 [Aphelenchoides fujianensis]
MQKERNARNEQSRVLSEDNCKSDKLREIILETIGLYPHQYSYQAKHMKQVAESRFGNWWSAVIISERGGYGMSAIYDQHQNTRQDTPPSHSHSTPAAFSCELMIFDTFYWLGRTC